mgnify:CR=1 FL=1
MDHSAAFLKIVEDTKPKVRECSIAEAKERMAGNPGVRLVDIREDREWALGHITGAEHIGKGVIERDIEGKIPDKQTEIILYCGGGYRSVLSADALQRMGYVNVCSMDGGWREWASAGYPVDL